MSKFHRITGTYPDKLTDLLTVLAIVVTFVLPIVAVAAFF